MALTKTQVSQLYVTLFGRASESSGSKFWQKTQPNMTEAATNMLNDESAKAFFGNSIDTNAKFVNHIYENVFGRAAEAEGFNFWVSALEKGNARGFIVSEMIKAAEKNEPTFNAKVAVSDYLADKDEAVMGTHRSVYVEALDKAVKEGVDAAKAYVDNVALDTWVSTPTNPGKVETLTALQEEKVANVFEAPMVYNPGGTDYIPSLQDEDKLIGIVGRSDNTLNVTLGQQNDDEGTGAARTPNLVNIQYLNAKLTGDVNHLDLRYADSLTKVNLHHFTNNADKGTAEFIVDNISSKLEGMRVANLDDSDDSAKFEFKQGILNATDDKGLLELADVNANAITITSRGNDSEKEGYENLDLVAKSGVDINVLKVQDLRVLNIAGDGDLEIAKLTSNKDKEYNELGAKADSGIVPVDPAYFEKLDASKLNGKMTVDISNIVKDWVDTSDSAVKKDTTIIGTAKDDTFYTSEAIGGRLTFDGGEGKDKFVVVDGNIGENGDKKIAKITNVESLELRAQKADAINVDFDAFDNTLEKVLVRDEKKAGDAVFTFTDVAKEFADNKKFIIEHSISGAGNLVTLDVSLKDSKATDDALNVEVINGKNDSFEFNYKIVTKGIEKLSLTDSDSENNTVELDSNQKTLEILGGKKDNTYTVDKVKSEIVNAATYEGDLRIQAIEGSKGDVDQSITLGKGDDIVTFTGLGHLTSKDKVVGGEGNDILRSLLDANIVLDATGVEELHLAATSSINLGIAGGDFGKLVFVSDESVNYKNVANHGQADKILGDKVVNQLQLDAAAIGQISKADIVTIDSSNLTELNFSGDLIRNDYDASKAYTIATGAALDQKFNGVKLDNNKSETLDININAALDGRVYRDDSGTAANLADDKDVEVFANSYVVGHVTAHGVKNLNVNITDDKAENAAKGISATQSSINNLTGKNLEKITLATKGNLDLGTVTSNAANNSISTFDATNVQGNLKAIVLGLGDGANVTMADGDNHFDALGSAGKLVNIKAGNGDNTIRGTAQSDNITTGNGNNYIYGDRGDNVIVLGKGNDVVNTRDGNDTVEFGGGYDIYKDNIIMPLNGAAAATNIDTRNATTTVTKTAGFASVEIDVNGNVSFADNTNQNKVTDDVQQMLAVGEGSDLKFQWLGGQIQARTTVLDGNRAINVDNVDANTFKGLVAEEKGTDQSDLWVVTSTTAASKVFAGKGNDVLIVNNATHAIEFNGGEGNDAAVGGGVGDKFIGGKGADILVMNNGLVGDAAVDTVVIADGESTVDAMDTVYKFKVDNDILDLGNAFGAAFNEAKAGSVAVGKIDGHNIVNNVITFRKNGNTVDENINSDNLKDALEYLAKNFDGTGQTIVFAYDKNNDGDNTDDDDGTTPSVDATIVFQDGTLDTVVELVGVVGITSVAGVAGANTLAVI